MGSKATRPKMRINDEELDAHKLARLRLGYSTKFYQTSKSLFAKRTGHHLQITKLCASNLSLSIGTKSENWILRHTILHKIKYQGVRQYACVAIN